MEKVAVVLVTWNQRDDVKECLDSLNRVRTPAKKIIVVDNASEDGTTRTVREGFPEAVLIQTGANIGEAAATNCGIRHALQRGIPYVFSLDTDTVVAEDVLDPLVEAMEADPRLGIVGPKMYFYGDPTRIWWAGGNNDPDSGFSCHWRYGEEDRDEQEEGVIPCTFVTGAGMFIRSDVFRKIGLFDEAYFHTSEDNDLCVRALRAGYAIGCVPQARIWHKIMSTTSRDAKTSPLYTYYEFRNRLHFVRKHSQDVRWLRHLDQILLKTTKAAARLLFRERNPKAAAALAHGIFDFLRGRTGKVDFYEQP